MKFTNPDGSEVIDVPTEYKKVTYDTVLGPDGGYTATFSVPTLPGYTFGGWWIYPVASPDGIRVDVGANTWKFAEDDEFVIPGTTTRYKPVSENNPSGADPVPVVMYAKWTPNTYEIWYEVNRGIGTSTPSFSIGADTTTKYYDKATVSVTFDTEIGNTKFPTFPYRDGYSCAGWYVIDGDWPASWDPDNTGWYREVNYNTKLGLNLTKDYDGADDEAETMNNFDGILKVKAMWYPKAMIVRWNGNQGTASTVPKVNGNDPAASQTTSYVKWMLYDDTFSKERMAGSVAPNSTRPSDAMVPATAQENDGTIFTYDNFGTYKQGYRLL